MSFDGQSNNSNSSEIFHSAMGSRDSFDDKNENNDEPNFHKTPPKLLSDNNTVVALTIPDSARGITSNEDDLTRHLPTYLTAPLLSGNLGDNGLSYHRDLFDRNSLGGTPNSDCDGTFFEDEFSEYCYSTYYERGTEGEDEPYYYMDELLPGPPRFPETAEIYVDLPGEEDRPATDGDTVSSDSSYASRNRYWCHLDTIHELEEPQRTQEEAHCDTSSEGYVTPSETEDEKDEVTSQLTSSVTNSHESFSRSGSSSVSNDRFQAPIDIHALVENDTFEDPQNFGFDDNTTEAPEFSMRSYKKISNANSDLAGSVTTVRKLDEKVRSATCESGTSLSSSDSDNDNGATLQLPNSVMISSLARFGGRSNSQLGPSNDHTASASGAVRRQSEINANREASAQKLIEDLTLNEETIQWAKVKLRYHFMNPCQKYRAKGTKPFKLIVQIIKIIFVTLQLALFSKYQFDFRLFIDGNFQTFDHLFLLNWDSDYADPVQRVPDPYAVYHIDNFYASVNYSVTSYFTLTYKALGNFSYPVVADTSKEGKKHGSALGPSANLPNEQIPPVIFRVSYYDVVPDGNDSSHMKLVGDPVEKCWYVTYSDTNKGDFDLQSWENNTNNNFTLNWSSLLSFQVEFGLINQHIGSSRTYFKPVCYLFNISINYDNSRHTGKLPITPHYQDSTTDCVSITYESSDDGAAYMVGVTFMDCFIISLAVFSLVLCVRSIQSNWHLRNVCKAIWWKKFQKPLSKRDEAKFVQFWYFIIIFGDLCLIAGSFLKIFVTFRVTQMYTVCAVLLGCATMIVWIGVLKYLNYFHTYNMSRDKKCKEELTEMEQFFNDIPDDPQGASFHLLRPSEAFICICCMPGEIDELTDPSMIIRAPSN
ncbi:uncharacterized protein LOC134845591 isoform X2 [Symsagittifera roscoffensis]|uniref:uncharacterized protein LOC134845591 isoform X2 n=1 Tax=Symsagittifera roscoffensis TaxID=84072 RepID=UPI00307BE037